MKISMEMRRKKQALAEGEIVEVIRRNTYGVLSLCDEDGMPYGVPLNYAYANDRFYFHCAKTGYKNDIIGSGVKAALTIVDSDTVIPETFSTDYISIIARGTMKPITGDAAMDAIVLLAAQLGIDDAVAQKKEIEGAFDRVEMFCFTPEVISGKMAMAVAKKKSEFFTLE